MNIDFVDKVNQNTFPGFRSIKFYWSEFVHGQVFLKEQYKGYTIYKEKFYIV